jgi:GNAT superfamily N-acetyltransferase
MGYDILLKRGTSWDLFEFVDRIPELNHEGKFENYRRNFVNFYADNAKVGGASYNIVYMNNAAPGAMVTLFGIFPEYRRMGLGRVTLQCLEDYFRERNDAIFVLAEMPASQKAYDFCTMNGYQQNDDMLFKWLQPKKFVRMKTR